MSTRLYVFYNSILTKKYITIKKKERNILEQRKIKNGMLWFAYTYATFTPPHRTNILNYYEVEHCTRIRTNVCIIIMLCKSYFIAAP